MRRLFIFLKLIAMPLLAQDFRIAGSDLLPLIVKESVSDYAKTNHYSIDFELIGSILALEKLRSQEVDLAIIALLQDEKIIDNRLQVVPFSFQIVIIAVHKTNPLHEISFPRLAEIYGFSEGRRIAQWSEFGLSGVWQARKIFPTAISDKAESIALELFKYTVLEEPIVKSNITLWDDVRKAIDYVEANNTTIAVMPAILPRTGIKFLSLAQKEAEYAFGPTRENVYFGDYPLRLPFYLVFERDKKTEIKNLLKVLLGDEIAEQLDKNYFVSLPTNVRRQLSLDFDLQ